MARKKKIRKGDLLTGNGAIITVMHVEGNTATIQNNIFNTINKVPIKSLVHLDIRRDQ